jgi:hypothetical protein
MSTIGVIDKTPDEVYPVRISYANRLPPGTTLASAAASAVDTADDSDATATLLVSDTPDWAGETVTVEVQGGTVGHTYQVLVQTTLAGGSVPYLLEDAFLVQVHAP